MWHHIKPILQITCHVGFLFAWPGIGKHNQMSHNLFFSSIPNYCLSDKNINAHLVQVLNPVVKFIKSSSLFCFVFFSPLPGRTKRKRRSWAKLFVYRCKQYRQAGDTRIPLPRKSLWTPQKIVDCKVGLCISLWTVAELLQQYSA